MATKSKESTDKILKPGDVICDYHKKLKKEKEGFELGMETAQLAMQQANIERGYEMCCLEMSEMTRGYYTDMKNYELHDMLKSTEIISTNLSDFVAKKATLQDMIQSSAKNLSDLKNKLHEAHDAACAMRNCINRHLDLGEGSSGADADASQDVKVALDNVMNASSSLDTDSQDAAEAMVKVAGIQTFTDVEGVQEMVDALKDLVTSLHTSADGYIEAADQQVDTTQEGVLKAVEDLNTAEFDRYGNKTSKIGVQRTLYYICNGYCQPINYVEYICQSMGKNEPGPNKSSSSGIVKKDER